MAPLHEVFRQLAARLSYCADTSSVVRRLCRSTKPTTRLLLISFVRCLLAASYGERCRPPAHRWYVVATQCLLRKVFFLLARCSTSRSFPLVASSYHCRQLGSCVLRRSERFCTTKRGESGPAARTTRPHLETTRSLLREITNPASATRMGFDARAAH